MKINIDNIIIKERLRNLNTNKVKELAESIKEIGLLNPIIINQSNELIAGLHRLNAIKSLGYSEIECNVLSVEGLKQELAEIDENFIRNELDYLDRGKHLKRRKEIYESLYPETKHGTNRFTNRVPESGTLQTESFVDNTSKTLNISKSTIAEEIQIANAIPDTMVQTFKEQEVTKQEAVKIAQAITQEVKPLKQEIRIIEKQQEEVKKEIAKVEAKQEIEIIPKEVQIEALKQQEKENERKRIETEKEIHRQAEIKANEILKRIEAEKQAKKELKEKQLQEAKENYTQSTTNLELKPTIYLQDAKVFLSNFNDNSIDVLITDPPYSTDIDDIETFAKEWLNIALDKLKRNGRAFICIGAYPKEIQAYLNVLLNQDKFIVDNPIIWTYKNTLGITPKMKFNLNYQMILHLYSNESAPLKTDITNYLFSVQEINAPDGRQGNRLHTWQKPDELAKRLLWVSAKENDNVVDCFACTGTFLLSASQMKCNAVGCDISKENLSIAKERGCTIIGM